MAKKNRATNTQLKLIRKKRWGVRFSLNFFVFCTPFCMPLLRHSEKWPSGLRRTPGKCVYRVKRYRGFESPFLR